MAALNWINVRDPLYFEFCGASSYDSQHLVEECPAFESTRQKLRVLFLFKCALPNQKHKYPVCLPSQGSLEHCLPGGQGLGLDGQCREFFTAGSAMMPDLPSCRVASWSIVVAINDFSFPLCLRGLLPGKVQTIGRAKLFAIYELFRRGGVDVAHTDCQHVLNGWTKALAMPFHELHWMGHPDADLWHDVIDCPAARGPYILTLCKVKAHQRHPVLSGVTRPLITLRRAFSSNKWPSLTLTLKNSHVFSPPPL